MLSQVPATFKVVEHGVCGFAAVHVALYLLQQASSCMLGAVWRSSLRSAWHQEPTGTFLC